MSNESSAAILITDMSGCRPAESLSRTGVRGKWRLIDLVIAKDQVYRPGSSDYMEANGAPVEVDYEYFRRALAGTNVQLYHDLMPRVMAPDEYRAKAKRAYAKPERDPG